MARFYGLIGFELEQVEKEPGIWESHRMEEKPYTGTMLRYQRRWDTTQQGVNEDLKLTNRISIVCDAFLHAHWPAIRYVRMDGVKWKVESAEINRPRIILTLGGIWHGDEDTTPR